SDPRPTGIVGLSMGGVLSLVLTCLDARLAFSVPMIAHMDPCALLADAPVLGRMRHELRAFGWGPCEMAEFATQIGWPTLLPKLPPERIHLFAASDDRFFAPAVVEDMWRRWGRPAIRWYPCSHMGFVPRLPEVVGTIREFIDRQDATRLPEG